MCTEAPSPFASAPTAQERAQQRVERVERSGHRDRVVGSVLEAESAVQETLPRAFRAGESFEGQGGEA